MVGSEDSHPEATQLFRVFVFAMGDDPGGIHVGIVEQLNRDSPGRLDHLSIGIFGSEMDGDPIVAGDAVIIGASTQRGDLEGYRSKQIRRPVRPKSFDLLELLLRDDELLPTGFQFVLSLLRGFTKGLILTGKLCHPVVALTAGNVSAEGKNEEPSDPAAKRGGHAHRF